MAAPVRKYDALDASPSTNTSPGVTYFCCPGTTKRSMLAASHSTLMPKRSMSLIVISTYGVEISSSVMRMVTPSGSLHSGEAMSSAVRYCDDTDPEMAISPDGSPAASTCTGGQPVPSGRLAATPSCVRPSTRSAMGRSRIRATPSSTYWPEPAAHTAAVSGRMAVPALPRKSSVRSSEPIAPPALNAPPHPATVAVRVSQSTSTLTPSTSSALSMY
mmetsp:Transcript_17729/g.55069  ORF Transcript_17729/g.55069 Transcript_17729/m.55069 type:complete len:217 (-) Transcript_17729:231-881(-)